MSRLPPPLADSCTTNNGGCPFALLQMAKDLEFGDAKERNFVFSPCSIQLALSLLATGAKGETLEQLLNFLESENLDHLKSVAAKQVHSLTIGTTTTKGGPNLSFVGGVWVNQSCPLKPTFRADAENIYKITKVETVDFQDGRKAKDVVNEVNEWAKEATKGLINSILPEGCLSKLTRAVLANALYFKGEWIQSFEKSLTKEAKFHLRDGERVRVPYMRSYDYQYIDTYDDFQVLRLPYDKSSISMYIILPQRSNTGGLWSLAEKVGSDPRFLEQYVRKDMNFVRVGRFMLPKFKIAYDFKAKEVLQRSTGLELPFLEIAEFDEMVESYEARLYVNQVYHKSYIEVNEEGTEAAAVTVEEEMSFCLDDDAPMQPLPPPVDFVADHAFMFLVRDDESGTVLFMGHVVNPLLE